MSENYIVINGKKAELTESQLKALGIKTEAKRNPFARVEHDMRYFTIRDVGTIAAQIYFDDGVDKRLFDGCNYFNDEEFARQVAHHQLLYRKLLKFAYDNECADNQIWGGNGIEHWYIAYDFEDCIFYAEWASTCKNNDVYFSTKEGAERAIKEVVKPFMKEHPDFVW